MPEQIQQQQQQQEQPTTTHVQTEAVVDPSVTEWTGPSREELIKAMDSAAADDTETSAEPAAQTKPDTSEHADKSKAAAPPPAAEDKPDAGGETAKTDGEEQLPKLARLLREREKARAAEDSPAERIKAEPARAIEGARAEAQKIIEQARAEAESLREQTRKRLAASPRDVLRELNADPQTVVDDLAREGTPEWRAVQAAQRELEQLRAKVAEFDSFKADIQRYREEGQRAAADARRQQAEQAFLSAAASAERCPSLHALYEPDEILAKAWRVIDLIRSETGRTPTDPEIAEYLEYQATGRLGRLREGQSAATTTGSAAEKGAPKAGNGKPPAGSRTLNAASASERRAGPRPISEMSPEEQRAALIEEAEAALRTAKP